MGCCAATCKGGAGRPSPSSSTSLRAVARPATGAGVTTDEQARCEAARRRGNHSLGERWQEAASEGGIRHTNKAARIG